MSKLENYLKQLNDANEKDLIISIDESIYVDALIDGLANAKNSIVELSLSRVRIESDSLMRLAAALSTHHRLKRLHLDRFCSSIEAFSKLIQSTPKLKRFSMRWIFPESYWRDFDKVHTERDRMLSLAPLLSNWSLLTTLDLSDCLRSTAAFAAACEAMKQMTNLKRIYLRGDNDRPTFLYKSGTDALADVVAQNSQLQVLCLRSNPISVQDSLRLFSAVQKHATLKEIELGDFTDAVAFPLVDIVCSNSTLTSLQFCVLKEVQWRADDLRQFFHALQCNTSLQVLQNVERMYGSPQQTFDMAAQDALINVLIHNVTLTSLRFLGAFPNSSAVADALKLNRTLQAIDLSHFNGKIRVIQHIVGSRNKAISWPTTRKLLIDVSIAFSVLQLPVYVILFIVNFLPYIELVRDLYKVRLLEKIRDSIAVVKNRSTEYV